MIIFGKDTSISLRPHIEKMSLSLSPRNMYFFFNMKSSEEPGSAPMVYLTLTPPLQLFIAGDAGKKNMHHI